MFIFVLALKPAQFRLCLNSSISWRNKKRPGAGVGVEALAARPIGGVGGEVEGGTAVALVGRFSKSLYS